MHIRGVAYVRWLSLLGFPIHTACGTQGPQGGGPPSYQQYQSQPQGIAAPPPPPPQAEKAPSGGGGGGSSSGNGSAPAAEPAVEGYKASSHTKSCPAGHNKLCAAYLKISISLVYFRA